MSLYMYLEDTGYVDVSDFSGTRFPTLATATATQKLTGEFRANNRILLKVEDINLGDSNNLQTTPNAYYNNKIKHKKVSKQPISLSLTCYFDKPSNFGDVTNYTTHQKDITALKELMVMTLTQGHKDLYFDGTVLDDVLRREYFSLYMFMSLFGRNDAGNSSTSTMRQHLNVSVDSYSINESMSTLSFNINMTILEINLQ